MQLVNGIKNSHQQVMKRFANFLAREPKTKASKTYNRNNQSDG